MTAFCAGKCFYFGHTFALFETLLNVERNAYRKHSIGEKNSLVGKTAETLYSMAPLSNNAKLSNLVLKHK